MPAGYKSGCSWAICHQGDTSAPLSKAEVQQYAAPASPSLPQTRQQPELSLHPQFETSKSKTSSWFLRLRQDPRPRAAAAPTLTYPQHLRVKELMPHVGVWSWEVL